MSPTGMHAWGDSGNDFVNQLLNAGFANGFVDALEERNFTADDRDGECQEFPPVLILRMRLPG